MDQTPNNNFAQDLAESEEAFKDQFNPNSANYHKGVTVPVPTGGQRVPEQMPTAYPEQVQDLGEYIQGQQQVDYGPEYDATMKQREFFNNVLKKSLNKLTMQVEALFRHQEALKKADESKKETVQKSLEKDTALLHEATSELKVLATQLDEQAPYKERYVELHKVIENAEKGDHSSKEQVAELNFAVKRITALAFKDSQLLLEKLKQIKKQHK